MSEQTSQEPTMEEILASIRRIISEDDAPGAEGEAEAAPAEAAKPEAAAPEPEPEPESEPVALAPELRPPGARDGARGRGGRLGAGLRRSRPTATWTSFRLAAVAPAAPTEALVSEPAALAAASAFGQLSAAITMPKGDRTLEDVVRELLRPLLQQWLDQNLPGIVQQATSRDRRGRNDIARGRVR